MTARSMDRKRSEPQLEPPAPDIAQPRADFHWLWRFVRGHWRATVFAVMFGMVGGVTSALEPYLIGVIIDNVREGITQAQLVQDALLLVGLGIMTMLAFFGQRYFSGVVAYSVNYDVRKTLFDNMLTLDQSFYQQYPTGDLISRMHTDAEMTWRVLALTLTRAGSTIVSLIVTIGLLTFINPLLTLIVFVVLSISTAFQIRAGTMLAPVFEKVQDQAGNVAALVQDSVSGIQTIKTTGVEAGVAAKFHEENREYRRRWLFFKRRNEPVGLLPNMISETTAAVVMVIGGYMTVQGQMTIGNFAQFLLYLNTITTVLLTIGIIYQRFQQTRGAFQRLSPLLQHTQIASRTDAHRLRRAKGKITYENVGLKLDDQWVLRDLSFEIEAGQVAAFVGPTGCGKTLLVNLIARVVDPTTGRIMIDDHDIRDLALEDLRRASAYVPQTTFLFSQALHKNVRMGQQGLDDEALERAIHISRMSNDLPQLPHGLETMVGEKGVMLSGGQKQRVAIARAIIRDPSILILDDALSSVDTQTSAEILADLRRVLQTRTSILIAHRIATVKDADVIFVMDAGRIIERGTHDDLVALDGAYARMVEREMLEEDRFYDRSH